MKRLMLIKELKIILSFDHISDPHQPQPQSRKENEMFDVDHRIEDHPFSDHTSGFMFFNHNREKKREGETSLTKREEKGKEKEEGLLITACQRKSGVVFEGRPPRSRFEPLEEWPQVDETLLLSFLSPGTQRSEVLPPEARPSRP